MVRDIDGGPAVVGAVMDEAVPRPALATPRHPVAWRYPSLYELYFAVSPLAARLRRRELDAVLGAVDRLVDRSHRVLEVGCGPGTYTLPIAVRCDRLIALDSSEAMLQRLLERAVASGALNVEARWGRVPDQLGDEGAFDGLVAAGVLDYLPDLERALTGLSRSLCSGGWAVFTVPLTRLPARPAALLDGLALRRSHAWRAEEVVNAAVAAGLVVRGVESVGVWRRGRTLVVRAVREPTPPSCPRCSEWHAPLAARGGDGAARRS